MPRTQKPARLWLRPGTATRAPLWLIKDRGKQISTGCTGVSEEARRGAEAALQEYLAGKHNPIPEGPRHSSAVPVADVLSIYLDEVVPTQAQPAKAVARVMRLGEWWAGRMLSEVTPATCREYAAQGKRGGTRRDLEDLRAAINHHAKRGFHTGYVGVELPPKGAARTQWLTRSEVARLIWVCYRHGRTVRLPRGKNKGALVESHWHDLQHIARFVLCAIYTGSRSGAVFSASVYAGANRSFLDLESGIFYRLAEGKAETNKRQPPVPIPPRLLAHIRRWKRRGIIAQYVVEWHGKPIASVKEGWKHALKLAGLDGRKIVPHSLRHSAASWLMQNGSSVFETARYLGMSEAMVERTYAHASPEYLKGAADRITRKRGAR